jgi:hypothetical protein
MLLKREPRLILGKGGGTGQVISWSTMMSDGVDTLKWLFRYTLNGRT